MKHRVLSIFMALLLALGVPSGYIASAYSSNDTNQPAKEQTDASEAPALSDYINREVLVYYTDGNLDVITYNSDEDLSAGLSALAQDDTVLFTQPNYSYEAGALSVNDPLVAQQWALSNDGSFVPEEENRYPVYENPFNLPSGSEQWNTPDNSFNNYVDDYNDYFNDYFDDYFTDYFDKYFNDFFNDFFGDSFADYFGMNYYRTVTGKQNSSAVADIDINAEAAWELYNGGSREVIIALIDTGVDTSHEDLSGSFWVNEDEIAGNGIDDDNNGYVDDTNGWNFYRNNNKIYTGSSDDSHGTHGAGTITASTGNELGISGVTDSDSVKIMTLKALGGTSGSGSTASLIEAIRYAEANGASICNLSLAGTSNDRALYQTIADSSMLFVIASGNDGANTDRTPCYPASYDLNNIISVANLSYDGTLHYSSNYGATSVDIAAPGAYILSTTPNNSYGYMTGTSMSAPMVSAAAAMLYSHYNSISLADVKEILLSTATELDSLQGKLTSGGMLNLGTAMAYDIETLPEEPTDDSDKNNGIPNTNTPSSPNSDNTKPETSNPGNSKPETTKPITPDADDKGQETPDNNANAPVIKTETLSYMGSTYLIVTVTDEDGDLVKTAYASGTLTAEDFKSGASGTAFSLDRDGSASFLVRNSGNYTFYAKDNAGNETVQTVTVTADTQQSPIISLPGNSNRNRNGGSRNTTPSFGWWH